MTPATKTAKTKTQAAPETSTAPEETRQPTTAEIVELTKRALAEQEANAATLRQHITNRDMNLTALDVQIAYLNDDLNAAKQRLAEAETVARQAITRATVFKGSEFEANAVAWMEQAKKQLVAAQATVREATEARDAKKATIDADRAAITEQAEADAARLHEIDRLIESLQAQLQEADDQLFEETLAAYNAELAEYEARIQQQRDVYSEACLAKSLFRGQATTRFAAWPGKASALFKEIDRQRAQERGTDDDATLCVLHAYERFLDALEQNKDQLDHGIEQKSENYAEALTLSSHDLAAILTDGYANYVMTGVGGFRRHGGTIMNEKRQLLRTLMSRREQRRRY